MHYDRSPRWRPAALVATTALAVALAGCGDDGDSADGTADTEGSSAVSTLGVVASFYPLQFVVERVGGDVVDVSNLTPAGAEPHDMELTPRDTASLQDADLVVYLAGFAPAVDDAVAQLPADQAFDVTAAARLDLDAGEHDHDHGEGEAHGDDEAHEEDDHDHGGVDPHFWLDPTRLADVAGAVADRLGAVAPDSAADFTANAAALGAELDALDDEFTTGLASCATTELVTSHTAFGYLADRYGLTQLGITGLSPHDEPSPSELAEVAHFVEDHDVSTIYTETLVDPAIADTVAAETGASTAVLDPLEGLTDEAAGADYFEVMRANLATLRTGQACS